MSGDSNGVVVYRATRLTMIEAVRSAHPAPAGRLRRNKRLSHAELADAILATLPGAEPDPLKAVEAAERIIAARDAEIELMRRDFRSAEKLIAERDAEIVRKNGRCDGLFATGRRKDEQIEELGQEARTSEALIETLRAGLAEAAGENATLREALARYRPVPEQEAVGKVMADVGYLDGLTERAERAEQRIAAAVTALRPLAKLKGPTVAERARVVAQVLETLDAGPQGSMP